MTIGERMKQIRLDLSLSQKSFGEKIGITAPSVARIESGENNPADRTIRLTCLAFNVSESWLRDGIGDPFVIVDEDDGVNQLMIGDDEFAKGVFRELAKLTPEEWAVFRRFAENISAFMDTLKKGDP